MNEPANEILHALIVDDDSFVRRTVQFALQQEGFHCDTAVDGAEAEQYLQQKQYDLLVTDLRMPNKHGYALANDALHENKVRSVIVHTAIDEPSLTKDMILRGVDDVVNKPTNYATLAAKAKGFVLRERRLAEAEKTADASRAVQTPPAEAKAPQTNRELQPMKSGEALSVIMAETQRRYISRASLDVLEMIQTETPNFLELSAAVQRDPSLTGIVLQLANCPFYNPTSRGFTDPYQVVSRIGQKRFSEITLASGIFAPICPDLMPWMDLGLMWRQTVASGIALSHLISRGDHQTISYGLLFTTLVHAGGRLILASQFPDEYRTMIEACRKDRRSLSEHEREYFGQDHTELLAGLLEHWGVAGRTFDGLQWLAKDAQDLEQVRGDVRTRVELLRTAVDVGRLATGHWEPWQTVAIPSDRSLKKLGMLSLKLFLEQVQAELTKAMHSEFLWSRPENHDSDRLCRKLEMPYCNLSEVSDHGLAHVLTSMGYTLDRISLDAKNLPASVLVNRMGASVGQSHEHVMEAAHRSSLVCVRDVEQSAIVGKLTESVFLPCSAAALQHACDQVIESQKPAPGTQGVPVESALASSAEKAPAG